MKAYLIICILLASMLFFPSSFLARELAAAPAAPPTAKGNPTVPCNPGGRGNPYKCRGISPKPAPPCSKYRRNCPPNSSPPKPAPPCNKYKRNCPPNSSPPKPSPPPNSSPPKPSPPCKNKYRRNCPPNSSP